tara:strand:- start:949 stop:1830 length:882 start_codon:yes stop_codon:yes gene_type:complete
MLLALHDVIDDDWLVHAVSFIFPYFCVYFHLFAQAKRLGRRLLLLLLFSFLRVSRRRRRRCYPPPRFREEELIHQSSSSSSSSRGGRGREKSSRRSTHRTLLLVCALFLTSAFQSIEYFSVSLSPQKKTRMSKRSFLDGTTLSSSSSLIISAAASAASVHPLYQKLLSSLLTTKTQQNHHHHFCRRSWYSSESNKEELEKEIGYYTGKKRNPLTDTRLHQYDQRPPPNALCEICSRRFCSCEENRTMKRKPEMPGPEDCCQSSPQCKFCVWTIYDEQLAEYETNKELYMDKLK